MGQVNGLRSWYRVDEMRPCHTISSHDAKNDWMGSFTL